MAPTVLDKLVTEREAVADLLELIDDDIKDNDTVPLTIANITRYLSDIETSVTKLHDIHGRIRAQVPADIKPHVDDYRLLIRSCKSNENALYGLKANLPPVDSPHSSVSAPPHSNTVARLPKLDLKSFDGNLLEWTSFRDMFESTIHNNVSVPKVQKLAYLKSLVKGEAARQIQSLILNDGNYDIAWTQLHDRYQNNREILFSILKRLFGQSVISPVSTAMKSLIDITKESLRSLEILNLKTDPTTEAIVMFLVVSRLDPASRELWEQTLKGTSIPPLSDVFEFLERRARALAAGSNSKPKPKSDESQKRIHAHHGQNQSKCKCCSEAFHPFFHCPVFQSLTISKRYELLKTNNLCFNCFGNHSASKCSSLGRCKVCKQKHNTLLHKHADESINNPISTDPPPVLNYHNQEEGKPSVGMLATAVIRVLGGDNQYHICRAFLDGGSTASFITEACIRRLRLSKSNTTAEVVGLGASKVGTANGVASVIFTSHFNPCVQFNVNALAMTKVTSNLPVDSFNWKSCHHLQTCKLADPYWYKPAGVDILLGSDVFWDLILSGRKSGPPGLPLGVESSIGWLVAGNLNSKSSRVQVHYSDASLDHKLQAFWELEAVPSKRTLTLEEEACESHFQSSHTRDACGRYIVSLPFRNPLPPLGSSRELALQRLKSLERRLERNPHWQQQYVQFMTEYLTLGHMSLVDPLQDQIAKYYIPHHFVLKEDSTSTKFRVVFDASAKSTNGKSLNDIMMTGPTLQDSLMDIIMRFRLHPVAFKADVSKMYRQIKMSSPDARFQRILWRNSPCEEVKEYQLDTVTYGTASAPYLAVKCLQQLAKDEGNSYPLGAQVLLNNFYVDDVMHSCVNVHTALHTQSQLLQLTNKGSLPLLKWTSNSPELVDGLPIELRESNTSLDISCDPSVKALGIRWNTRDDCFEFQYDDLPASTSTTISKRRVLSEMSKLFDPLGWFSPVIIRAKILMQSLWKLSVSWDDPLPEEIQIYWKNLKQDLSSINQIKIPRCQIPSTPYHIHLAGFSDASEKAYGACVYLCVFTNEKVNVSLIASKTRVAPVSQISIPRLELCGAVLLSNLMESVHDSLRLEVNSQRAWTDSTDVLSWIQFPSSKWKTFVANRVGEIQRCKIQLTWGHVPGISNPADFASRGLSIAEITNSSLWWSGPAWLQTYHPQGPHPPVSTTIDEVEHTEAVSKEMKPVKLLCCKTDINLTLLNSKSNLDEIVRITAWIRRFLHNSKPKSTRRSGSLTPGELQSSLFFYVKSIQHQCFISEIRDLEANKPISSKSRLLTLNPFLDVNGLVRVGGRLRHSIIPESRKNPLVLPRHSRLTELLISRTHLKYLHAGPTLMMTLLQQQFWILRARDALRFYIRKCIICTRQSAVTQSQFMGDLPSSRVIPCPPFQRCGVDYAGPFLIKPDLPRSKVTLKAYMALFVCFTTRAFHLELVNSLSTDSFLAALRRFVSRRGLPAHIHSDGGTNFVGASKE